LKQGLAALNLVLVERRCLDEEKAVLPPVQISGACVLGRVRPC